jgi:hypothetical protein
MASPAPRPAAEPTGPLLPPDGAGSASRLLAALPAVLLLFALVVAVAQARRWSHEVPTWHLDGAFQFPGSADTAAVHGRLLAPPPPAEGG